MIVQCLACYRRLQKTLKHVENIPEINYLEYWF